MSEKYINEQIEKSPDLKEFGGLAPECMSDECDLHIKEPENYSFVGMFHDQLSYKDIAICKSNRQFAASAKAEKMAVLCQK